MTVQHESGQLGMDTPLDCENFSVCLTPKESYTFTIIISCGEGGEGEDRVAGLVVGCSSNNLS